MATITKKKKEDPITKLVQAHKDILNPNIFREAAPLARKNNAFGCVMLNTVIEKSYKPESSDFVVDVHAKFLELYFRDNFEVFYLSSGFMYRSIMNVSTQVWQDHYSIFQKIPPKAQKLRTILRETQDAVMKYEDSVSANLRFMVFHLAANLLEEELNKLNAPTKPIKRKVVSRRSSRRTRR